MLYFKGLNGLRAIAALSVLFSHTTLALGQFGLNPFVFGRYSDGNPKTTLLAGFGVSIFFSLSGFLITYLLLQEKKVQPIRIKNFYLRRILRIWPLYYAYLLASFLTIYFFELPFDGLSVLFYLFLAANVPFIEGAVLPFLSHYWSIGVEEQFYAFWPWVVNKTNPEKILNIIVITTLTLIVLKTILRIVEIRYDFSLPYTILHVTRFQCMLIGAIGAMLYFNNNSIIIKYAGGLTIQIISWFVILLVAINYFHIMSFLDNEILSVVTVALIIGQIENKYNFLSLDRPPFNFLGKISYGIYVIHPLLIFFLSRNFSDVVLTHSFLDYFFVYLLVFACTIFLAFISYEILEKHFLERKAAYTTIASSNIKPVERS